MMAKPTIGIDFGTAKCCVATVRNNKAEVLPNARGDRTTPSWVAFNDVQYLVGGEAKDQALHNPRNSIYGVKNILGRACEDERAVSYRKMYAPIMTKDGNRPMITIHRKGDVLKLRPELVAAMLLLRMKQEAEAALGEIGGAVVSVPVYATNAQREAIVTACKIADLELLDLISEPTATALVYRENLKGSIDETTATSLASKDNLKGPINEPNASTLPNTKNKNRLEPHNVLVFDMGAGKLDASLISVSEEEVRVLAASGDEALGGDHLDWKLLDKIEKIANLKFKDNEPNAPRDLLRRKFSCEKIKLNLTLLKDTQVTSDDLGIDHMEFKHKLTRNQFEETFSGFLDEKLKAILSHLIKKANIFKAEVKNVIVVGGSSRIPRVQQIIMDFFGTANLNMTVNADEAIAEGAALWAHELASQSVHPQDISESSGHPTCFNLRDLVPDPSKIPGENNLKHFIERKADTSISIRAPKKGKKGSDGHRQYKQGKYGIFLVQSQELPLKLAVSLGMMPPLFKNQVSEAVAWLGQLETERGNYMKQLEVADELEHFCYDFRSKLNSLLASTEEVIEFLSAIDGMVEKDAEKIKNGLLEKLRKLSTLDENHVDNESSLSKNEEDNGDCPLVPKDADSKIRGTDREKVHFSADMSDDDYENSEDHHREKIDEPVCTVAENRNETISHEVRRKNNKSEHPKVDGKQVTCVNASSDQLEANGKDKPMAEVNAFSDHTNVDSRVSQVAGINASSDQADGDGRGSQQACMNSSFDQPKVHVISDQDADTNASSVKAKAHGSGATSTDDNAVAHQTHADIGCKLFTGDRAHLGQHTGADQAKVDRRCKIFAGGNASSDQFKSDGKSGQIECENASSAQAECDGRDVTMTGANAGADKMNDEGKGAPVAGRNGEAIHTNHDDKFAPEKIGTAWADQANADGSCALGTNYDQSSSPLVLIKAGQKVLPSVAELVAASSESARH
ncbi:hypothetical protein HAZT_HAZT005729 [Hyalella azteca]|uniref:Uncharacterized protein n=1 Tax=Hyalella azteca TaxID=294128 RepID=A0A6A0H454_HYAAZ|nr:hypothetical protein HAZT_HAZT005729 [Hyalella azteca]